MYRHHIHADHFKGKNTAAFEFRFHAPDGMAYRAEVADRGYRDEVGGSFDMVELISFGGSFHRTRLFYGFMMEYTGFTPPYLRLLELFYHNCFRVRFISPDYRENIDPPA